MGREIDKNLILWNDRDGRAAIFSLVIDKKPRDLIYSIFGQLLDQFGGLGVFIASRIYIKSVPLL